MPLRVSLVNLQKLTLWPCVDGRQHLDVGSGAEDLVDPARDDHDLHLGVLEAHSLDDVVAARCRR